MHNQTDIYKLAEEFVLETACPVFLTGKAGTGKTTFLKQIRKHAHKQIAIVAPTGVAAINAGGTTIHSFFQLPFTPFAPIPEGRKNLIAKSKISSVRRKVLQELELLIIDEISMVRADLLDAIDTLLRHFRFRPTEPFGGVQLIYIGDMYQLSPVVPDEEWQLLSQFYKSPYFFDSQVIQQQTPVYIELDRIFRQTNEQFISLLNEVRNDRLSNDSIQLLNERYIPDFRPKNEDGYITLTTHNAKADRINREELTKIKTETFYFDAQVQGDFPEKSYPNEPSLELKKGARVMFIANDTETPRRYYNGKIGVIADIDDDQIWVDCEDDTSIEVKHETWENVRYAINKETNQIEEEKLGTYTQYPLRLAWAITIHKSQGLTFEKVVIDAAAAFASGQVYVALSRCRSLEGIVLSSFINKHALTVDQHIIRHAQQKKAAQELKEQIGFFKNQYNEQILQQIFDLNSLLGEIRMIREQTAAVKADFNDDTMPFIHAVVQKVSSLNDVANSFRNQLTQLCSSSGGDILHLSERIKAASGYFTPKLKEIFSFLETSPAISDSRTHSREYTDSIKTFATHIAFKKHLIEGIKDDFSVSQYFKVKVSFTVPVVSVNAYAAAKKEIKADTEHQALFRQLVALRKELCEESQAPVYTVAKTQSLLDLCHFLPRTPEELIKIKGFGKVKTQKYGPLFLEIIRDYCKENGLR
ncbi:MAG: AAA family ATPase [Tannerella sp.]|jgi:hypothetical protein|nr:AAA family ATPase [Tannerella sp.]